MAFTHPDDLVTLKQTLSPATLLLQDFDCEYRVIWPDDSVHWIMGKGYSIEADPIGVPTRLIGVNIDITQRKSTEAALLQVDKLAASNLLQEKGHLTLSLDANQASAFNWDIATNVVQWTGRPPMTIHKTKLCDSVQLNIRDALQSVFVTYKRLPWSVVITVGMLDSETEQPGFSWIQRRYTQL